jgi:transcription initiation factor TFIIIB Brf1 subunit/transcription initiation factor TFIIB
MGRLEKEPQCVCPGCGSVIWADKQVGEARYCMHCGAVLPEKKEYAVRWESQIVRHHVSTVMAHTPEQAAAIIAEDPYGSDMRIEDEYARSESVIAVTPVNEGGDSAEIQN